jgi:outer membrane protein
VLIWKGISAKGNLFTMLRTSFSRLFVVAASGLLAAAVAPAQSKVAVINSQKALLDTAEIKKALADLDAKYKPRRAEMEKLRRDLDDIQQKLRTLSGKLTQQAEADMTLQGQRKERDLQRMTEDLQADAEADQNDISNRSRPRMQEVVRKIAEAKGVDLVVDVATTVFFKPALEITAEATAAYDKAYPRK